MIVEYLRYSIDSSRQAKFIEDYNLASGPLLASPYCTGYELCQCNEDETQFIIRIEWTSAEDHLEKFRSSVEFREFFQSIKSYIPDIDEMRHYTQLQCQVPK